MLKIKDGYISRNIAGEYVAVPSGDTLDLNQIITMNETAFFMWEKMEKGITKEDLITALLEEYEGIDYTMASNSIDRFIEKLKSYDVLQ